MSEPLSTEEMLKRNSKDLEVPLPRYLNVVRKVLEECRKELMGLDTAVADRNFESIHMIAHKLKGTCGTVQLDMIATPAARMDDFARKMQGLEEIRGLLGQLKKAVEQTDADIKKMSTAPKTILIVDDDPTMNGFIRYFLENHGYEVSSCANGEVALREMNNRTFDLVLLDVQMPHMDGYSFLYERKKTHALEEIPVIVITSHPETEPLFKRHGIRYYLLKPLKMNELLNKIKAVLEP